MVPVDAKVAAILRPMWPDLPRPLTISLPRHLEDHRDRALERVAEAVGQRVERPRFVVQDVAPEREHVGSEVRRRHHRSRPSPRAFAL